MGLAQYALDRRRANVMNANEVVAGNPVRYAPLPAWRQRPTLDHARGALRQCALA